MNLQPMISFSNVSFTVNNVKILRNVTGSIYKGKITTLIGPSGAGKTTLLKMCNGLISPSSGSISINGQVIESFEPTVLRRYVGIALQSATILRTTVFENLMLPRKLQQQELSKEEALSSLQAVGLDADFLLHQAADLSGGQKQKLSIARTLINESEILLLDEITSALDPSSVREIEELIVKLNEQFNVTIIWITHNIDQAMQLGHFTWLMKDGQLIVADESKRLSQSQDPVIQQFLHGGEVL